MMQGLQLLYALGALDDDGLMTVPTGLHMAELPLTPMQSKVLITSRKYIAHGELVIAIVFSRI